MKTVLHVGLPKTGTTYMQNHIFPSLAAANPGVLYNPPKILHLIRDSLPFRRTREQVEQNKRWLDEARAELSADGKPQTLLISNETMSRALLGGEEENFRITNYLFPEADVFLVLRFQTDWILSCYKQIVADGCGVGIEKFLNYSGGTFKDVDHRDYANLNIHALRYARLMRNYVKAYGRDRVHVCFYEEFLSQPEILIRAFCHAIGGNVPQEFQHAVRNRSLSALAVEWKLLACMMCRKSSRLEIPWTERHGKSVAFVASLFAYKGYRRLAARIEALAEPAVLRKLDRFVYVDWDILKKHGIRDMLNAHFRQLNAEHLPRFVPRESIPRQYYENNTSNRA